MRPTVQSPAFIAGISTFPVPYPEEHCPREIMEPFEKMKIPQNIGQSLSCSQPADGSSLLDSWVQVIITSCAAEFLRLSQVPLDHPPNDETPFRLDFFQLSSYLATIRLTKYVAYFSAGTQKVPSFALTKFNYFLQESVQRVDASLHGPAYFSEPHGFLILTNQWTTLPEASLSSAPPSTL